VARAKPKEGTRAREVADLYPLTRLEAKPESEVEHITPELRPRVCGTPILAAEVFEHPRNVGEPLPRPE
jgi:hypothetical protein